MKKKSSALLIAFFCVFSLSTAQELTIYEIQGQQEHSPYDGQTVSTYGIVTGVYSSSYFIQDGEGEWNGLYIYSTDAVNEGDEVELTGVVDEYYDMTELTNVSALTILSSGNPLPEPAILDSWDVNEEAWESVLVRVEDAVCTNDNLGYGEWELDDGTGPCRVNDLGVIYSPVAGLSYSVTGPLNYSFSFYKIEPRVEGDIVIEENLYFTKEPEQVNPEKTLITLQWETNIEATTQLYWGYTPDLEQGMVTLEGTRMEHELQLPGVPSTIFYINPFSVAEGDTTSNFTRPYATVSNSSGEVKLYFNHNVDHSVAGEEMALWTPDITDTVIHYFNMTQQTLDITMYEQESDEIVQAINAAYDRGVQVRYITDDEGRNPALENLNENIPVLYGNTGAIMHNKFIVIDADSEMNSWVITGSLNHTHANLGWDYNNMICIQDKSMAMGFTLEFEEMWGSDGPMFDEENAKFGAEKKDNTPHKFVIGEIAVDSYFSPSDGTTSKIKSAIDNAQSNLEFGIMVFTENSLGTAIVDAQQRGLNIRGIIDYVEYTGSEYQDLKDNGVPVRDYVNPDGSQWPDGPVFHHKYAIVDFLEGAENPIAITGSHNWSAAAEGVNDENTLIIYDASIANQFHQEFHKRFNDLLTPVAVDDDTVAQTYEWTTIKYLDNDFIPEDISISKEIIQYPIHGEAGWVQGEMAYRSDENFNGVDSMSYRLYNIDNSELADTAWVRIEVGESSVDDFGSSNFSFRAIPNSNTLSVMLEIDSDVRQELRIKILNLTGKQIYNENISVLPGITKSQIGLISKTSGLFLIDVTGRNGKRVCKIIF